MDLERLAGLVLFGFLHWVLAIMLLQDLSTREHVLGGHKMPWVIAIILVTFIGSIAYLVCHPSIFYEKRDK